MKWKTSRGVDFATLIVISITCTYGLLFGNYVLTADAVTFTHGLIRHVFGEDEKEGTYTAARARSGLYLYIILAATLSLDIRLRNWRERVWLVHIVSSVLSMQSKD